MGTILSRAEGALLGQLAGDALGSLVEFKSPDAIRAEYPGGVRDLADGGTWNTLAGQPTDDSELALALARTLIGADTYSEVTAAGAYGGWYASGPFDIGGTTSRAFSPAAVALARAENPAAAAREAANGDSQANGALMRVSPLGIFGWRFPSETVAGWARADASLSHPHPVCQDANALVAVSIAHAVAGGPTPDDLYRSALSWAEDAGLRSEIRDRLELAASGPPADFMVQQGWVLIAFQNAFYRLLHAESFEEGVVETVGCGGDTDTNACIAGALLGACYGRTAVPERWQEKILSCRPEKGRPGVERPRPEVYWPVDALELAAGLIGEPPPT